MEIAEALKQLTQYANEFAQIGDANEAVKNNREEFLHRWTKVMQYYRFIISRVEEMSEEWFDAIDILTDIYDDNPSLKDWVLDIIEPKRMKIERKDNKNSQRDESIDTASLSNKIDSLVTEINSMQSWDEDKVDDIAWQLREYQEQLKANQSDFEPGVFASLLADSNAALNKIERFTTMLSSETFENLKSI